MRPRPPGGALTTPPAWQAHRLADVLDSAETQAKLPDLLPDGKSQVSIEYRKGKPERIQGITLVNPEGPLIDGGPSSHSGLTGRKSGVATSGEYARHSEAALSGKDPMRIDRVAAYAARYAAKKVVAAGLAEECEVSLSDSVDMPSPANVRVRTFGTGQLDDGEIQGRLREVFDFRVAAIVCDLKLRELPARSGGSFYRKLAVYGHMGRTDLQVPWERVDRSSELE